MKETQISGDEKRRDAFPVVTTSSSHFDFLVAGDRNGRAAQVKAPPVPARRASSQVR